MPSECNEDRNDLVSIAELLKAMAHPVRLMIIKELLKNPRCVTAIHEILDVRQPNISQHLGILRNAGLVGSDRDGAYRCYFLRRPRQAEEMIRILEEPWEETDIVDVRKRFRKALTKRLEGKRD